MRIFLAIYGPIVTTLALVMAFARTGPAEARSKLSEWAEFFGLKKAAKWLGDHALDQRVVRYGKLAMVILLFVGAFGIGYLLNPNTETSTTTVVPSETGANQLGKLQYEQHITLGRISFHNMFNGLISAPPSLKGPPKQWVVISSSPENLLLAEDLRSLFFLSSTVSNMLGALNLPNYERDLDAPKFEGNNSPGITIHGRTPAADFIETVLGNCFLIRRTSEMPAGVIEYYNRLHPTTISRDDVITWLEIGKGLPWKARPCIGPGN